MSKPFPRYLIALADDDIDDREIFSDVCSDLDPNLEVLLFENGHDLVKYLNRPDAEIPATLFLDINMPVKNGFETLSAIRGNSDFNGMCIVMYSTSIIRTDVEKAKMLGANAFLQKPYNFAKFNSSIRHILDKEWENPCEQLTEGRFLITA